MVLAGAQTFNDAAAPCATVTVGAYLAERLVRAGCSHFFTVPGDFTLSLLDEMLRCPRLRMVTTCNELNCGYAADGFSRATGGLSCAVVTYMVGGLSILNAAAGAMAEGLPMLIVSGAPNSHDASKRHLVHHSTGLQDFYQSHRCFQPVVQKTFVIRHIADAASFIDQAITTCLSQRKPVYLEIACNLSTSLIPEPAPIQFNFQHFSDAIALESALADVTSRLQESVKPVIVVGALLRSCPKATNDFHALAETIGCAVGNHKYLIFPFTRGCRLTSPFVLLSLSACRQRTIP